MAHTAIRFQAKSNLKHYRGTSNTLEKLNLVLSSINLTYKGFVHYSLYFQMGKAHQYMKQRVQNQTKDNYKN